MIEKLNDYLNEESISKIYELYTNVLIIETDPNVITEYEKKFGKVLLDIESKKKSIVTGDYVVFDIDRIKWKSKFHGNKIIVVINPYWVKKFIHEPKIPIEVDVLKSKTTKKGREYYIDVETIKLTFNQFFERRKLELCGKYQYCYMQASRNFNKRYGETNDYYKALNEVSKHYGIEHHSLKQFISAYSHIKKNIKSEWSKLLLKYYENNQSDYLLSKLMNKNSDKKNVISLKTGTKLA